jgi:hypothetical protein
MPIRGVLDLQLRSAPLGEIRIGTSVEATARNGKSYRKPVRLDTFRFTTGSEHSARVIAEKYGGQVAPWARRKGQFEVITDKTALEVWVPPRGEAVDSNMEAWDGPRRLRKCDGITMSFPERRPCMCPQADDPSDEISVLAARDERKRLAGMTPPQACKPLTRLNVTIPDLPGLTGVWKLNTGSENAAVEMADSGETMAIAREGGVYLPALLVIQWRTRAADGKPYPVLALHIGLSMRDVAQGALPAGPSGLLAQLRAPGHLPRAIEAPSPAVPVPGAEPVGPEGPGLAGAGPGGLIDEDTRRYQLAQDIADRARITHGSAEFRSLIAEMKQHKLGEEFVCEEEDREHGVNGQLEGFLRDLWRERAKEGAR